MEELHTLITEEDLHLIFISESWEREHLTLDKVIKLDDYKVVSNVSQRSGKGGRPAIIANHKKFQIQDITNTIIQVPWGVEAVWCILTPNNISHNSKIQKIACCAIYSKPDSRKKTQLLDHISESFNILNTKFGRGLEFILAGDTNDLNLDPILALTPKFQQIVKDWTRLDPPAILDPIITTLSSYYQVPECLEPLDADPEKGGKKSDHKIVIAKPIDIINNKCARTAKIIKFRPLSKSGMVKMKEWFIDQSWEEVTKAVTAHEKASVFQKMLLDVLDEFFPEKLLKINNDDQPWISNKLKKMDRKRKRLYRKERRSENWKMLDKLFKAEIKNAKAQFYKKTISNLKQTDPGKWYSWLKRISCHDQKDQELKIDDINHLTDQEQAEQIAETFSAIPNEYEALKAEKIDIPPFQDSEIPQFEPSQVWLLLCKLNTNKATVKGDFPVKLIKIFAAYLAEPLTDIFNTSIRRGEYPKLYKFEICTPVPKEYPVNNTSQLRNISGLLTFDKIFEKLLAELMISDMKPKFDPSQYGNQKGISIQHYLINMIHAILSALDNNSKGETFAVIANFIDWNSAFPRQCPQLGVESFQRNGVRPALIPVLINYFQDRQMSVKWRGCQSVPRNITGGGPQGATIGLLEYLSQSNNNADIVSESERFKFLDDLSILEIVNLLTVGISSYNLRQHIPSNIPMHNQFISPQNLKSQCWLDWIDAWTKNQKMQINVNKTKTMIFNFTEKYQFGTKLSVDGNPIDVIDSTQLLGTTITSDLRWDSNTRNIVRKANARMELLRRVASFGASVSDLKNIYFLFVRSQLEHSAVVWHCSLSQENKNDLERVQKSALKVILGEKYKGYKKALNDLCIETLDERRESLCLKFAKRCIKNEKATNMFPLNKKKHLMNTRNIEKYKVEHANTERFKTSPIIYMQNLLNQNEKSQ